MSTVDQVLARHAPERFLERLDRLREQKCEAEAAPIPALIQLAALRNQISERFGTRAVGLLPRLAQVEKLVLALFPADPVQELPEKDQVATGSALEAHFEELEDMLYALSQSPTQEPRG